VTPQADGLQALACQGEMNMQATMQLFGIMMAVMLPVSLIVFITEYFKLKKNTSAQTRRPAERVGKAFNQGAHAGSGRA
jgi:hypothetical protein